MSTETLLDASIACVGPLIEEIVEEIKEVAKPRQLRAWQTRCLNRDLQWQVYNLLVEDGIASLDRHLEVFHSIGAMIEDCRAVKIRASGMESLVDMLLKRWDIVEETLKTQKVAKAIQKRKRLLGKNFDARQESDQQLLDAEHARRLKQRIRKLNRMVSREETVMDFQLLRLFGAKDRYSRQPFSRLIRKCTLEGVAAVEKAFEFKAEKEECLRWFFRGLHPSLAIRRALLESHRSLSHTSKSCRFQQVGVATGIAKIQNAANAGDNASDPETT